MFTSLVQTLSQHLLILAAVTIGFFLIIITLRLGWLYYRVNRLLSIGSIMSASGGQPQSIEQALVQASNDLTDLKKFTKDMEQYLVSVEKRLKKSVQGIGTVRYNPFQGSGTGGNNSFSAAFLNEHGDGVVLTSMYVRDRVSVFGKPVKHFESEHGLSDEEQASINSCRQKITTE
jgi:hypothetical protein